MSYQIFLFHKRVFCDQNQQLDVLILVFLNLCMECATSHLRDKLLVIVLSNLHRLISEVGVSEAKFDRLITGDVW